MLTGLTKYKSPSFDAAENLYKLADLLQGANEVVKLDDNNYLFIHHAEPSAEYGSWIKGGLFTFHSRSIDESEQDGLYESVFIFEGPGGPANSLREFRHSWWGEKGYNFYLPIDTTIKALEYLKKHFD